MVTKIYDIKEKKYLKDIDISKLVFKEEEFDKIFFDTESFHKYHENKCETLYKVLNINRNKVVAYYYMGVKNDELYMPYSSPFSLVTISEMISYEELDSIVDGIINLGKEISIKSINITLPPFFYNKYVEYEFLLLINRGFKILYVDINHYYNLYTFINKDDFVKSLNHAQRKNYKRALKEELVFLKIDNEDFLQAFDIIEQNRKERSYPLRMDRRQIEGILKLEDAKVDFFIVKDKYENIAASAMIYKINCEVAQVIYWGHLEEYNDKRPMSLLSIGLCEHYKELGIKYLDIGPSSEEGKINLSLSQFKTNMGCEKTSKFRIKLDI